MAGLIQVWGYKFLGGLICVISPHSNQESPLQTKPKQGAETKSSWISPFFRGFGCFSLGKQAQFISNFGSDLSRKKFMNRPFFGLVCRNDSWSNGAMQIQVGLELAETLRCTLPSQQDDLLELYCGNGNFCVALVPLFRRVLATELVKDLTVATCTANFRPPLTLQPEKITYINFVFGINVLKIYNSVTWKYFTGINFPKITLHVFICDSENYIEKLFGNYFLGKSHFSYINKCFRN